MLSRTRSFPVPGTGTAVIRRSTRANCIAAFSLRRVGAGGMGRREKRALRRPSLAS